MSTNDSKHKRRSIRLPEYDYSQEGAYYITICTQDRKCIFGKITNGRMLLSEYGKIADQYWKAIPEHFTNVILDEFVMMPNHIHGIIIIAESPVGTRHAVSLPYRTSFGKPQIGSLSTIIRSFKSAVTKKINIIRSKNEPVIWQGRYYEHVIRSDKSFYKIREYICNNPLYWAADDENPDRITIPIRRGNS